MAIAATNYLSLFVDRFKETPSRWDALPAFASARDVTLLGTADVRIVGAGSPEGKMHFESAGFPEFSWPARSRWFMPAPMTYYSWAHQPAFSQGSAAKRDATQISPERTTNADL